MASLVPNPGDLPVEVLYPAAAGGGNPEESDLQTKQFFSSPQEDKNTRLSHTSLIQEHYLQTTNEYDEDTFLKLAKAVLETEGVNYEDWKESLMNEGSVDDYYPRSPSHSGSGLYADDSARNSFYSDSQSDPQNASSSSGYYYDDSSEGLDDDEDEEEEEEEEEMESLKSSSDEERPTSPLMGMKSFKALETRALVKYMLKTDDERMHELRRKLKKLKKVEAPRIYKFKPSKQRANKGQEKKVKKAKSDPKPVVPVYEDEFIEDEEEEVVAEQLEGDEEGMEDEEEYELLSHHSSEDAMFKFKAEDWALKNTLSFLRKEGCPERKSSYEEVKVDPKKLDPKTRNFLSAKVPKKKKAVGDIGPDISPSIKRLAERTFLRALIKNSKPKFPLARFILPQYRFTKKIESSMVGPGSYEIESLYDIERRKRLLAVPSSYKSCSQRFPRDAGRPPACDAISNPWKLWELALDHYKYPGKVTMFESAPCNYRAHGLARRTGVAPNHYKIKSPLQEFLDKRFCTKTLFESGMYDTCKDSLPDLSRNIGPGTYDTRGSMLKDLTDPYDSFKGKFSETPREKMFGFKEAFSHPLWPVNNDLPGPATYSPYSMENLVEASWAPFGTQVGSKKEEFDERSDGVFACADYYNYAKTIKGIKEERTGIIGGGWRVDFDSKSPQTTSFERYAALKERNKALNHKWDQNVMRSHKNHPAGPCDT